MNSVRGVGQFISRFEDEALTAKSEFHSPDENGHAEALGVGMLAPGPSLRVISYPRRRVAPSSPVLFHGPLVDRHRELALGEGRPLLTFRVGCLYVRPTGEEAKAHGSKKGASIHYWITSSARSSSDGGTVRPRALAVLRLMTRSNLVGCSMGRSPGRAPRKILCA